jgi:glycosyltransferase involved in cell wall biosynthesis
MNLTSFRPITVSVVIPTIGRQSILRAIDSICTQVGGMLNEIVICFDNTDNTIIADHDHTRNGVMIRVVHNRGPKGVASALNCAIAESTGTLIVWLSDDDFFSTPIRLLRAVNMINRNGYHHQQDGIFFFGDFLIMDDSLPVNRDDRIGRLNPHLNYVGGHVEKCASHYEYGQRCLSKGLINGCTAIFSKALWSQVGGFQVNKKLQTIQDTVFWMSIIEKSSVTAYLEGADATSVQHAQQGQRTLSDIVVVEVEQLKTVVHLKNLRDFQLKRFTLKAHFNFFFFCSLLSVSPVSVFSLATDNPVRQLSEFEFEHNAIAVLCRVDSLCDRQECLSAWNVCVAVLREALANGDYCAQFFDAVLHFYIVIDGSIMRMRVVEEGVAVEFADCPEYARLGDILLDYRYLITGELRDMVVGRSTVHENLETLLLREDLIDYWSFIDQRDAHIACVNKLIVRAPWSFTQKP